MIKSAYILLRFVLEGLSIVLLVALASSMLAFLAPRGLPLLLHAAERPFFRLAHRKTLSAVVLFFSVIALRLAILPALPVPVPGIHDEFSYLLLGDTLAHGRLATPTHPMWMSFESFHVNWFPTYSSKYPPAQGAVLALGQLLGHPWIGVLLSDALMCAAILWMLQAWLPPRWALLGGILVALKFGIASYWMNSYWGGSVAATGGAFLFGAMPRLVRHARLRDSLLLGAGISLLANTRPFEGFLFCIPAAGWFLWWLAGKTKSAVPVRTRFVRGALPAAAVLALTLAFMGYYNWRLTGNAFLFPHVLNSRTYRSTGLFLWERQKPPLEYHNQQFEDFYNGWEREDYNNSLHDVLKVSVEKMVRTGSTYFWWGSALLLPGLLFAFFDRRMRLPVLTLFVVTAGVFSLIWSMPHYNAPLTCILFLLLVQAIRHLRQIRLRGRPLGLALSWAAVCLLVADVAVSVGKQRCDPLEWTCQGDPSRAAIQEKLSHTPGKHLIMVRYDEDHNIHDEWVYNGAEIDSAKVLWARELGKEQNARLFAYFKDRQVWLVTPDTDNTFLGPYSPPAASTGK